MKKFKIAFHPAVFPIILIGFFTGTLFRMLTVYLCLLIHESGHAAAAMGLKTKVAYIKIMPFGISMRLYDKNQTPKKQLIISLAGPTVSIIAGVFSPNEFLRITNLTLGIFNLLPVKTLDGGRIFYILMSGFFGSITAYRFLKLVSVSVATLLLFLGAYAFYITGYNISIALVSVFLIYSLVSGDEYSRYFAHRNALDYKGKKSSKGIFKTKTIAISQYTPLRRILSEVSSGRLCIINIIDDNKRIIDTITEQEAVDIMLKYGAGASFASAQKEKLYEFRQNT